MVVAKIFVSSKSVPKQVDHQEKTNEKDWVMRDAKPFGNKDSRPNNCKKKDINSYKDQNPLTPKVMEKYCKENQCFCCSEQGHNYHDCPKKNNPKDTPQATHVLSIGEQEVEEVGCTPLCHLWGKLRDQSALILIYLGSTHNFIS